MRRDRQAAGRWVSTFALDIEPGDKIRRNGQERHVVNRTRPPATQGTFRLEYGTEGENISKIAAVQIWDPDGSVTHRVDSRNAEAVARAGNSGRQGGFGGPVEPV
jgi:hypothetical protein